MHSPASEASHHCFVRLATSRVSQAHRIKCAVVSDAFAPQARVRDRAVPSRGKLARCSPGACQRTWSTMPVASVAMRPTPRECSGRCFETGDSVASSSAGRRHSRLMSSTSIASRRGWRSNSTAGSTPKPRTPSLTKRAARLSRCEESACCASGMTTCFEIRKSLPRGSGQRCGKGDVTVPHPSLRSGLSRRRERQWLAALAGKSNVVVTVPHPSLRSGLSRARERQWLAALADKSNIVVTVPHLRSGLSRRRERQWLAALAGKSNIVPSSMGV